MQHGARFPHRGTASNRALIGRRADCRVSRELAYPTRSASKAPKSPRRESPSGSEDAGKIELARFTALTHA